MAEQYRPISRLATSEDDDMLGLPEHHISHQIRNAISQRHAEYIHTDELRGALERIYTSIQSNIEHYYPPGQLELEFPKDMAARAIQYAILDATASHALNILSQSPAVSTLLGFYPLKKRS